MAMLVFCLFLFVCTSSLLWGPVKHQTKLVNMVQHQSKAAKQSKLDEGSKYVIVFYCGYLREIS